MNPQLVVGGSEHLAAVLRVPDSEQFGCELARRIGMKFIATNSSYRESVTVYRVTERPPVKLMDLD